jgi:hypothetical protein
MQMKGCGYIFQHTEITEKGIHLKTSPDPHFGNLVGFLIRYILSLENYFTACRFEHPCNQVEQGTFSSSVWADKSYYLAFVDIHIEF